MKANQRRNNDFKERFKGKTSIMDKEGHLGLVQSVSKPISKEDLADHPTLPKRNSVLRKSATMADMTELAQATPKAAQYQTLGQSTPLVKLTPPQARRREASTAKAQFQHAQKRRSGLF